MNQFLYLSVYDHDYDNEPKMIFGVQNLKRKYHSKCDKRRQFNGKQCE